MILVGRHEESYGVVLVKRNVDRGDEQIVAMKHYSPKKLRYLLGSRSSVLRRY